MTTQQRSAVWLLGTCQCVLWGVLYYSFSVLLVPIERELGLSRAVVAGAFSCALLTMALLAPAVGRRLDAGEARRLLRTGAAVAVLGLVLLGFAANALMLYAAWCVVGVAMAALLYEPAFALVTRALADHEQRLRALAAVTVMGGLASTVFLPLLSWTVQHWGWRPTVAVCVAAVLVAAVALEARVLPGLRPDTPPAPRPPRTRAPWPRHLPTLAAVFATGTLAAMAVTTLLIPLMLARGASPLVAGLALAAMGIAQLPGRIWLLRSRPRTGGALHLGPIVLQAVGLAVVVLPTSPWLIAFGVASFGVGAGLQTLVRPWLVQRLYGEAEAGRWNGEVARVQGFARAAGPVAVAALATLTGTAWALGAVAALLALSLLLARRLPV
ncbi:MAG TPA: MFS transporter [Lysobacter sp.]|nr:MFS transporter [Lysobacter sp.]